MEPGTREDNVWMPYSLFDGKLELQPPTVEMCLSQATLLELCADSITKVINPVNSIIMSDPDVRDPSFRAGRRVRPPCFGAVRCVSSHSPWTRSLEPSSHAIMGCPQCGLVRKSRRPAWSRTTLSCAYALTEFAPSVPPAKCHWRNAVTLPVLLCQRVFQVPLICH